MTASTPRASPLRWTRTTLPFPGLPTGGSVTPGIGSLTVEWEPPYVAGSPVHAYAYQVRHRLSGTTDWTESAMLYPRQTLRMCNAETCENPRRYETSDLTGGSSYEVEVRAHNANGAGSWLSIGATYIPDILDLEAEADSPTNLATEAVYGLGIFSLHWDEVSGAAGYKVQWEEAVTGARKTSGTLTLTPTGGRYGIGGKWGARWIRVAACTTNCDSEANLAWSKAVQAPADPLQVWFTEHDGTPNPTFTTGKVWMNTAANISLDGPGDSVTCSIAQGRPDTSTDTFNEVVSCPPGTLLSLDEPTTYSTFPRFPLWAIASSTSAPAQRAHSGTHEAAADGPWAPEVWASGGNGRLKVVWTEVEANDYQIGAINGYIVQRRNLDDNGGWSAWTDTVKAATDRSHTFTGLADATYQVRVRAKTDGDDGNPMTHDVERNGTTSTVRTVAVHSTHNNQPGAPGASVAAGKEKLTVTWQRPSPDTGSLVHGYTVRHKVSGAADGAYVETKIYPRPGLASGSVELTGLTGGTAYVVQIRSHNANGDSDWVTIGGDGATHTPWPLLLVGNTGHSPGGGKQFSNNLAQAFTTGSNAGGYKLTGVGLVLNAQHAASYSVSILADSSGSPGAVVGTLATATTTALAYRQTFSSNASGDGIDLAPNTTYYVRPTFSSHASTTLWTETVSDGEDGLAGFTIADVGIGAANNRSYNMAIHGYPK